MKCCIVRDPWGKVVAAYPLSTVERLKFEIKLENDETTIEKDIPEKAMLDPESFYKACSD